MDLVKISWQGSYIHQLFHSGRGASHKQKWFICDHAASCTTACKAQLQLEPMLWGLMVTGN